MRFYLKFYPFIRRTGLNYFFITFSGIFLIIDLILNYNLKALSHKIKEINVFEMSRKELNYFYNIIKSERFSDFEFISIHHIVGLHFIRCYLDKYSNNIKNKLNISSSEDIDVELINYRGSSSFLVFRIIGINNSFVSFFVKVNYDMQFKNNSPYEFYLNKGVNSPLHIEKVKYNNLFFSFYEFIDGQKFKISNRENYVFLIEYYMKFSSVSSNNTFKFHNINMLGHLYDKKLYPEISRLFDEVRQVYFPISINHFDFSNENIIITKENKLYLLDIDNTNESYFGYDIAYYIFFNFDDIQKCLHLSIIDIIEFSVNFLYSDYAIDYKIMVAKLFVLEGVRIGISRTKNPNKSYYSTYKIRLDKYLNLLSSVSKNEQNFNFSSKHI